MPLFDSLSEYEVSIEILCIKREEKTLSVRTRLQPARVSMHLASNICIGRSILGSSAFLVTMHTPCTISSVCSIASTCFLTHHLPKDEVEARKMAVHLLLHKSGEAFHLLGSSPLRIACI